MKDINWVTVTTYDELTPWNVIESCHLKSEKDLWKKLLVYCPELKHKKNPKDRKFFFNILNTLKNDFVHKIVYNAHKARVKKGNLSELIDV